MREAKSLLESTKSKVTKDENGKNLSHLETTEVVLVHCNIANSIVNNIAMIINKIQESCIICSICSITPFVQLIDISPKTFVFLKTSNLDFSWIEVWFTDQNSQPLDIEDKINITLVIN